MGRTERVCRIEMLIRNRGCVSFAAMRQELEVSPATRKRDPDDHALLTGRARAPFIGGD